MPSTLDRVQEIVSHDLDPEFVGSLSNQMAWEYHRLYESLAGEPSLPDVYRNEEFGGQRNLRAVRAIAEAAKKHRVPFKFRRLECNGQRKLLIKSGRVMLIQEPMSSLTDHPRISDYKRKMAESCGFVRQLEFDFGDQPSRIHDWSGCVLSVVLHGSSGARFTREDKTLGGLMLAVPDATYQSWVMRLDLHRLAMFGFDGARPFEARPTAGTTTPRSGTRFA